MGWKNLQSQAMSSGRSNFFRAFQRNRKYLLKSREIV